MIKKAERPLIYAGGGVLSSGAEKEVLELSKRLDAPVSLSMMGITAVPWSYPLNLGMCGMHGKFASIKAQSECDLMLAVGVRFSDRATGRSGGIYEKMYDRTYRHRPGGDRKERKSGCEHVGGCKGNLDRAFGGGSSMQPSPVGGPGGGV